jgi:hypothetical protein
MSKTHYLYFFFVLTTLLSCSKNETDSITFAQAKDYFPVQIGKSWTYDIDSIKFDIQNDKTVKIDTLRWQAREVVVDTFKDRTGQTRYKIERYERKRGETTWKIAEILSVALTKDNIIRSEGGFTFIKMPNVLVQGQPWDGNIFNDPSVKIEIEGELLEPFAKKWSFNILNINKPDKIGDKSFENVLTIEGKTDTKILTDKRYLNEKYALGIGLIYKEEHILDTQKLDGTIAWEKKAEKGYIVIQKIVSF